MKPFRLASFVPLAAMLLILSGCNKEEISNRQLESYNGLSYKYQEKEPFTGVITDYPMNLLGVMSVGSCRLEMEKGLPSGSFDCHNNAEKRVAAGKVLAGKLDGVLKVWNPSNDQLVSQSEFSNGRKNGEFTEFYPASGQLIKQANYVNDQLTGNYKEWLPNGDLLTDLMFENGHIHSGFKGSYDFGFVHLMVNYQNGKRHGEYINYKKNGDVENITNYVDGIKHGDVVSYNHQGVPHVKERYIDGVKTYEHKIDYNTDGSISRQVTYVLADEPGPSTFYEDMVKDGVEESFYEDGDLEYRVNWDKGTVIDAVRIIKSYPERRFLTEVKGVGYRNTVVKDGPEKHYPHPMRENDYEMIEWQAGEMLSCESYLDGQKVDRQCNWGSNVSSSNFYPNG